MLSGFPFNSDAGSQYTSIAFTTELRDSGLAGSIGSVGDALDNALMESTVGLFKTELVNRHVGTYRDRTDVEQDTADWAHWYNNDRLHSSISYLPPVEFEQNHHASSKTAGLDTEAA